MMKLLVALVAAGMGFVLLRMALVKAGLAKPSTKSAAKDGKAQKMSQLRRELDILLWIPPALLVIGALYALFAMWTK